MKILFLAGSMVFKVLLAVLARAHRDSATHLEREYPRGEEVLGSWEMVSGMGVWVLILSFDPLWVLLDCPEVFATLAVDDANANLGMPFGLYVRPPNARSSMCLRPGM